jgi:Skp family chaperone for outer membrane proteins
MKIPSVGLVVVLASCVGAAALTGAFAQTKPAASQAAASRVAACDVTLIFTEYRKVKDIETKMTNLRHDLAAEDDRRAKKIQAIEMELKDSLKPHTPAYNDRMEELTRLRIERETWQKAVNARESEERKRIAKEIYEDFLRAVSQTAKEQGCQIVLNNDQSSPDLKADIFRQIEGRKVLYCDPSADLTVAVLTRLNDSYHPLPH